MRYFILKLLKIKVVKVFFGHPVPTTVLKAPGTAPRCLRFSTGYVIHRSDHY